MIKMLEKVGRDLPHYLTLFGILFVGYIGLRFFSYDQFFQVTVAIATSASYIIWGVVHHSIHRDLYLAVIIEYVVVASLGLIIVLSIIFRV